MLDSQTVEHIALLARVGITEDERDQYQQELTRVLDFVDELKMFENQAPENSESASVRYAVPRTDRALDEKQEERKQIIANMPDVKGNALKVRQVL